MSANMPTGSLAAEVDDARRGLIEAAETQPEHWWTTDELLAAAKRRWRGPVFMIALDELLSAHKLETNSRWRVRLRP
jgi:hypothetical protein